MDTNNQYYGGGNSAYYQGGNRNYQYGNQQYYQNDVIQDGDGEPEITADEQLDEAAEVIDDWIRGN